MVDQNVKTWDNETGSISALTSGCSKSVFISDPNINDLFIMGIEKWSDPYPVTGNEQFFFLIIPDCKNKLSVSLFRQSDPYSR